MQHWINNMGGAMKDLNPAVKESLTAQDHIRDATNMVALTSEQAQQIEEALANTAEFSAAEQFAREQKAIATIRAARAQEQEPVAWYDKIKGMEVSMDVSTGEDDIHHRIFGRVDGVMLESCGAQNDIILAIEDSRNFASPLAFRFPRDTESWTGGWTIDYKVIRSVDAEIEDNEFKPCLESVEQVLLALEKVYAAPQPVKQEPVCSVCCKYHDKENPVGYFLPPANELDSWEQLAACDDQDAVPLYTAPVRTKDLTDYEIGELILANKMLGLQSLARAAIAADREKNR